MNKKESSEERRSFEKDRTHRIEWIDLVITMIIFHPAILSLF